MSNNTLKPATIAARAAGAMNMGDGGVVPGISVASTYARGADNALMRADNLYGRDENDTVRQAEEVIRQLEGAADSLLFPSGMAAIAALFRTLPAGARVIMQSGIYWGATVWVRDYCARYALTLEEVDSSDITALESACATPADLVWIEVPSNPWLKITDIARAADQAHAAGAFLAVDGTASSPVLSRVLDLGADISMHSATKSMNGHSDIVAGVLSCGDADAPVWRDIAKARHDGGAILGPFEAWLLMRGLRTLPLRMERMCANALRVAQAMAAHDAIETVWYPGLPDHPGHAVAAQQMCGGYGCLVSILVRGDAARAIDVSGRLQLFHRATSLGGVESLIEHRVTIEPDTGIPGNLLRLSIGIEDADDLIADLDQALAGGR